PFPTRRSSDLAEEHRYAVAIKPPRNEGQRRSGGIVDPVRAIDHADHRLFLGSGREQAQDAAKDRQTLADLVRTKRKRRAERDRLRIGKRVEKWERRPQELMQPREGDLDLRFDAERAKDAHIARPVNGGVEQGGLADS